MELRVSLGRKPIGSNLVTNGTFTGSLAGWTVDGAGWTYDAGTAKSAFVGTGGNYHLRQTILTPGKEYRVAFDLVNQAHVPAVWVFFGEAQRGFTDPPVGTYTFEGICYGGSDLIFDPGGANTVIDNVTCYELGWNDPLEVEPEGLLDAKYNFERDKVFDALTYKYISEISFSGAGFSYIYDQYQQFGYCGEIPVLVEMKPNEYEDQGDFFEGVIYLKDIEFDYDKRKVKTTIENRSATQVLAIAKDIKVYVNNEDSSFNLGRTSDGSKAGFNLSFHDITGAYPGGPTYDNKGYNVYTMFRQVLRIASKFKLEFESDFFLADPTFMNLAMLPGCLLSGASCNPLLGTGYAMVSFGELFTEFNKIFNLGMKMYSNGGVPTVKVEPKVDLKDATIILSLDNVSGLKSKVATDLFWNTINIGYKNVFDTPNYEGGVQYHSEDSCVQNNIDLICEYITDSYIIFGLLDGSISDGSYDTEILLVETNGTQTTKTNVSGSWLYNQNLQEADNMQRWVEALPGNAVSTMGDTTVTRTTTARIRIFEFSKPITKAELDMIVANDGSLIEFSSPYLEVEQSLSGEILSLKYSLKTGLTEFRIFV